MGTILDKRRSLEKKDSSLILCKIIKEIYYYIYIKFYTEVIYIMYFKLFSIIFKSHDIQYHNIIKYKEIDLIYFVVVLFSFY